MVPLRRATAMYSPIEPVRVVLSSQVEGTASNHDSPGQLAVVAYDDGVEYQ